MAKRLYRFGAFSLDLDRRLLARAGEPVGVSPRGFDILQVLVEQRAQVMSRAEIMAQVWPGVSVEEHNLSVQMSKLRRVLGDSGEDGQVIATVPGRGYRFVAALEEPDSGAGAAMPPGVRRRRRGPRRRLPGRCRPQGSRFQPCRLSPPRRYPPPRHPPCRHLPRRHSSRRYLPRVAPACRGGGWRPGRPRPSPGWRAGPCCQVAARRRRFPSW